MNVPKNNPFPKSIWIPALLLISLGGALSSYYLIFGPQAISSLQTARFTDTLVIPFDWVQIGPISFPISVDNFLIFEEFKSLPPEFKTFEAYFFGGMVLFISSIALILISEFKKTYFLIASITWITLLTFSNFNGLNIGGLNTNIPLISLITGSLLPSIVFHIWGESLHFWIKWLISAICLGTTITLLIFFSTLPEPTLYLAHHATILSFGLSIAWIFWNGHAVISGSYLLLCKINRSIKIKISLQMMVLSGIYLILLIAIYLDLIGDTVAIIPLFNPLFLVIPLGIFGWIPLQAKLAQTSELAARTVNLKILYLLGFGISLWLIWKLEISGNRPASELFKHLLVYSQFGFSLFFIIYLFSNFFSLMDSGKPIGDILYKPHYLPYYHLRIGGLITLLLLTTIADGIIGVQTNSLTNNILGDYFYETDQKLEASILYENAWAQYRNNPKAKQATAQLLFQLNQPSLAKKHLEESLAQAPQVDNIILLSDRLHRENKIFESIYYLERGHKIFPHEPKIANNLALLYFKINRIKDVLKLLENTEKTLPVLQSNLLAIKIKTGQFNEEENENQTTLIHQINQLAASNSLGNIPKKDLMESIQSKLQNENSPLILQAALRNIHSQKNRSNPEQDLQILDSLLKKAAMQEYIMSLQETAVIRNLGAGKISEAIKNLNGLAFRNPSDAGYFLQFSSSILTQNLDFKKSTNELLTAEEKGFQAFKPHHLAVITLAGFPEKALELGQKYQTQIPEYLHVENGNTPDYLLQITNLHELQGDQIFENWKIFAPNELKTDLALRILSHKSHDLEQTQILQLTNYLSSAIGQQKELEMFFANQDRDKPENLKKYLNWLKVGENLTANPYLTPLIFSAAASNKDPLISYQILNDATEFNADPLLWMTKIQAARAIGLDNYANEAFLELLKKIPLSELQRIQEKTSMR